MLEWIQGYETILWWLAAASTIMFLATLIIVPVLVVRIPDDYFTRESRARTLWARRHPAMRLLLMVIRNTLGFVLVVMGLLMLVLPGQGVITILIGITLLNFPGKFRLERWVVERGPVLRSINWLRRRAGRPALILED